MTMEIKAIHGDIASAEADVVIVNLFEKVVQPSGGTGAVDAALGGIITDELRRTSGGLFTGKLGETLVLPTYGKLPARYVVVVGLGKADDVNSFNLRRASAAAIHACRKLKAKRAATLLHGAGIGGQVVETAARLLGEGAWLGDYRFTLRKGKKDKDKKDATDKSGKAKATDGVTSKDDDSENNLEVLTIVEQEASRLADINAGLKQAKAIALSTNTARDWVNDSPNYVTPDFLKQQAEQIKGLTCKVLSGDAIAKAGMGSFASVAQGSVETPHLIHLSYTPSKANKTVALVGKGITFDSGGLSLKPSASMETMKMDMAGAAAVLATMKAISELGELPIAVHAFVPTCENMPSGSTTRPGDVVTALNGKTIEINNTDAEGRLILADALVYAQQQCKPDVIIDLATLTGACIVALGKIAAGAMGTCEDLIGNLQDAGGHAGEKLWQLPLYEEYESFLKSDIADMINSGAKGEAGSSAGAIFLKEFIEEGQAWAHLDIAGPAWITADKPETPKGASGFGVRTLLYYLYGWQ